MENQWDYRRCIEVLNQEAALLNRIFAVQASVRQAVLQREWIDYDWKIAEIRQFGMEFAQLDAERTNLFTGLASSLFGRTESDGKAFPFYALAARLPENERREITKLYRALKMDILRMQAMNESFLNFLNEARTAASAYLEAAFPARGGKLYTRMGGQTGQDLKSIVFNRHI